MIKDIVILANSRMHKARCIAGKDIKNGEWVRLKNEKGIGFNGAFPAYHLNKLYSDYYGPRPLDIVRISFSSRCPLPHQPENMYVDWTPWSKIGKLNTNKIEAFLDKPNYEWIGDNLTYLNKVPKHIAYANKISSSLIILKLSYENNKTTVKYESNDYEQYKPRLEFLFANNKYNLPITDDMSCPICCEKRLDLKLEKAYVTLGLGEEYNEAYFKLVIGIIPY